MSSTSRGSVRVDSDYYPTPLDSFIPLLPWIKRATSDVWEPACGDGRLIIAMNEFGIKSDGSDINAPHNPTNFLNDDQHRNCLVTNPPFSLAFEFCKHAVRRADHVFLLLRLNFLASKKRAEWFRENEPSALLVLSDRPSFVLSCKCQGRTMLSDGISSLPCGHKFTVPVETPRPILCPMCNGSVKVTSSDSAEYAWYYWGNKIRGIHHL